MLRIAVFFMPEPQDRSLVFFPSRMAEDLCPLSKLDFIV